MFRKPKQTKYRKSFKGGSTRIGCQDGIRVDERTPLKDGICGLRSLEVGRRTARQRESGRRTRRHHRPRDTKVWVKVFPHVPVTKKPREVRIGNGKGNVEYWVAHVRPGTVRYEVGGRDQEKAAESLKKAAMKRPLLTSLVYIL